MTAPYAVVTNDFSTMDDDALAAAVSTLAAHIHAATYRMGARILSALDASMEGHAAEQPAAGWDNEGSAPEDVPRGTFVRGPSRTVRRADALAWMAKRMFEPADAPVLASDRHAIVVHLEAEVLADGRAGRCEIEHRTAIAAETARRLCCDAGIVPVVDGPNGEPLSVGRRTRSIPPAVRRALSSRDRGCRFPGCSATHRLHGHHVRHWANGGETSLDNLILLCPTHHRLVHEGGFDDGAFRFTTAHGWTVRPPQRRETSSPDIIVTQNESLGLCPTQRPDQSTRPAAVKRASVEVLPVLLGAARRT